MTRKCRWGTVLLAGALATTAAQAQSTVATATRTKTHVERLSGDALGGRMAGSAGEKLAADYLVQELKRIGARPLPGQSDFRLPFSFTAGSKDSGSTITVTRTGAAPQVFSSRDAVMALSYSDNGEV